MRKIPKICIILVNYNTSQDTLECVNSLLGCNYDNLSIVIVDNGSSDENIEILKTINDDNVHIIYNCVNAGFSGGNNIGIIYSLKKGTDFICLLNNDTVVESDFLVPMVETLMESSRNMIVCPRIIDYFNREKTTYGGGELNYFKGGVFIEGVNRYDLNIINSKRRITFASGCCMLMKKELFDYVGMLPEQFFLYYEDAAFSAKVIKKGYNIIYDPRALIYHKESTSTKAGSPNYQYYFVRNRLFYIKEYFTTKQKLTAYPISIMYIIKKILKGDFDLYNPMCGVYDFIKGKSGKRDKV